MQNYLSILQYVKLSFVQGVDNIYTQHEPYITAVLLDQLIKGKLRDSQWPACPIPSVEPRYTGYSLNKTPNAT